MIEEGEYYDPEGVKRYVKLIEAQRNTLRNKIIEALDAFDKATFLRVKNISVTRRDVYGNEHQPRYGVSIDIDYGN